MILAKIFPLRSSKEVHSVWGCWGVEKRGLSRGVLRMFEGGGGIVVTWGRSYARCNERIASEGLAGAVVM